MTGRSIWAGLILATLTPTIALSQGLEIDHKAVGCIVVGKYPKMNACFTPAANLAKSRVYFRPEGTPSWYYVDMKSDQPCLTGILPRPGKKLVGKHVEYYLEAQNKAFVPSRTEGYAPIVVRSAQECKKNIPVAPFLNNATVAVFPSVPAGFVGAGGIGSAAVVGIVGAGAAAATTAIVVANNNNDDNTTTTIASSVNPTTTAPTVTTTLPTTTTLPKVNHAPNAVLRTKPDPPQGVGPLTVIFDMCGSSDSDGDPLTYYFEFGDGNKTSGSSCVESHTYAAAFREATAGKVRSLDSTYTFQGSAVDPSGASGSRSRTVIATNPAPPPPPACGSPSVNITSPANGQCQVAVGGAGGNTPVPVSVTATDSQGISNVVVKGVNNFDYVGSCSLAVSGPTVQQTATGSAPNFSATLNLPNPTPASFPHCYQIGATATNSCGNAASGSIQFILAASSCYPFIAARDVKESMAWSSDLDVEGGRLQLVVNGSAVSYPDRGRAYGTSAFVDGVNRVEATLVEGKGKAGVWRFEFLGVEGVDGSIRVLAGDVVTVAATSITFRLKGTPGERIAFIFDKR
jgi:hypothetical protein